MKDKLKVEGQSPESTEQEGVTPKSTDICICETDATQDRDNSPEPQMKVQMRRPVSVDHIVVLDGKSKVMTLRIQDYFGGAIKYAEINLVDLEPKTLKKCVIESGGLPTDWKDLWNVLMEDIKMGMENNRIKVIHGHTKLGWIVEANGLAFYHQDVISSNNQSSEYMGQMDIKPKGTLGNIVNMIKSQILPTSEWSPLEAIIAFSVASVVLPFAKYVWGKNMNNPILHLLGDSTTGKSTALRLNAGLASNPFNEKSGFWLNHQSSLAALIRRIGNNQGFSVSIDELSSASTTEYSKFVYTICNGDEKDRLKAGGTALCDAATFCTIVVSSGEVSILSKCSANTGIRARCVEFRNVNWTDSKEQADAIYDCLRDNYGWVAPLVAQELLNNSDKWKTRWDQIYNQIKDRMDEDKIRLSIAPRISEFVVLFTLASEIANKILNISLNVNEILDFCYLHVITVSADEANLGERAYEYLLRYASEHPEEFQEDERCETFIGSYYSKTSIKGYFRRAKKPRSINGKEYRRQLVFFKDTYEKLLEDGGFSPTVVSHKFRSAKLLQTKDPKRCTCELPYNNTLITCYALFCNDEDEMMYEAWANGTYNPNGEDDYEG